MRYTIRPAVRSFTVIAGSAALALALAGCGGDQGSHDADATSSPSSAAKTATDSASTSASETPASTTPSSAAQPLSQQDLDTAKTTVHDFYAKVAAQDYAGACTLMMNPTTNHPLSGTELQNCGNRLKSEVGSSTVPAEITDMLTPDKLDARDSGDGSATVTLREAGRDFPYPIAKASDGKMYVKASV